MNDRRGHASVPVAAPLFVSALFVAGLMLLGCNPAPSPSASVAASLPVATATTEPTDAPSSPIEPSPTTALPTAVAGTPACTPADLKVSHGRVEGAAGSRFTEVVLNSDKVCSVDAFPAFGLRDANGDGLVGGVSGGPGRIDLAPNVAQTSAVGLSNWCAGEPAFPLELVLILGAGEAPVTGTSFPEEGDLPECNGDGGPILQAGGWTPAP